MIVGYTAGTRDAPNRLCFGYITFFGKIYGFDCVPFTGAVPRRFVAVWATKEDARNASRALGVVDPVVRRVVRRG